MSAYNIINLILPCRGCGKQVAAKIQFKYGDVWQYSYQIGDQIKWGKNNYGKPGQKIVVVDGAGEDCPACGVPLGDYEVWVENSVLKKVEIASGKYDFVRCDENFIVVE